MKKQYEEPKAEKIEFDYSESVVASGAHNGDNGVVHCGKGCQKDLIDNQQIG